MHSLILSKSRSMSTPQCISFNGISLPPARYAGWMYSFAHSVSPHRE